MKKYVAIILTAVLSLGFATASLARKVEDTTGVAQNILEKYEGETGVSALRVSTTLLNFAKTFAGKKGKALIKPLTSVYVFTAGNAAMELQEEIVATITSYFDAEGEGYEKLTSVSPIGDSLVFWCKMPDEDTIVDLTMINPNEATVVAMTGNISVSAMVETVEMFTD